MPFALRRYRKRLLASRLLTTAELRALERALPPRSRRPEALADALIAAGKLTAYQAAEIDQGRGRCLLLGNYVLLDTLGAGGMGRVFKARHRRLERIVALKTLSEQAAADDESIARFRREAWAVAQLAHPNIVAAYDADEADGIHFLVMEFVDGPNLSDLVRRRGPLPIDEAARYTLDAARGLSYAHAQGFVHRDVKPSNLVLDASGLVKLLDLGLARSATAPNTGAELTLAGDVVGTAEYMAPEQAFDTRSVDARADIYSLGATIYRLVTGELMYRAETPLRLIAAHREQPIPLLSARRDDVPRWLETLYKKMVAKEPDDRPQTMDEVVSALDKRRSPSRRKAARTAADDSLSGLSAQPVPVPVLAEIGDSGEDLVVCNPVSQPTHRAAVDDSSESPSQPRIPPLAALTALAAAIALIVLLSWKESTGVVAGNARSAPRTAELVEQWSRYLNAAATETNSLGMQFVLIPPGEFTPAGDDASPASPIEVARPFYCGAHEVTVGQFRRFVEETGYRAGERSSAFDSLPSPAFAQSDRHPAVNIGPADALAFCDWLSRREGVPYRLPTEDEWEHACRAGGQGSWWFGDDPAPLARYAWYSPHSGSRTHQVGLLEPNPFGLYDLLGNAAEWCLARPDDVAVSTAFAGHVLRGGGWSASAAAQLHASARAACPRSGRASITGFRVVRELSAAQRNHGRGLAALGPR
ncbi:MAG TPA: bifunctional serine/threonine-protein kinase/formylglycine-generating enzyme family protein [Pirellulales bacterium]|nr:bifunctional serine/threonine-protein kinase/formylglycine-generating enzyme family protein [Pirellulales bacterium]